MHTYFADKSNFKKPGLHRSNIIKMKFEINGYIASTSLTYRPNRLFAQWSICTMAATMPNCSNLYGPYHTV